MWGKEAGARTDVAVRQVTKLSDGKSLFNV